MERAFILVPPTSVISPQSIFFFFYKMKLRMDLKGSGVSHCINTMSFYLFPDRILNNGLAFMS